MTIIYTDNGTRFINEKECVNISHNEESKSVEVWMSGNKKLPYFKIEGVERVRYVSDGHDFEFDSSTDELKRLNKRIKYEMFRGSRMRDCYHLVRNFCITILLENFVDADKETFKKVSDEWKEVCDKIAKKQDEIAAQIGLEINQNNKEL
jgi:hypothetical protein